MRNMANTGFAVSMTVLWSVVLAAALHSQLPGICLGIMFGMAFGLFCIDKGGKDEK